MQGSAQEWAPAVLFSIVTLTIGVVILLKPITKRLGELLDVLIQEKRHALNAKTDLDNLDKRVQHVEDRMEFAEQLIAPGAQRVASDSADTRPKVTAT